jgi:hypothetical protein
MGPPPLTAQPQTKEHTVAGKDGLRRVNAASRRTETELANM